MLELEADYRRNAIVEQTIAELKSAGLAHLPSGHFMANAAWLALTVMAHNLGRAVALLAGGDLHRATAATLRRKVFSMPGRLVHTGRRRHLRLAASWPWAQPISNALRAILAIPLLLTTHPRPHDQDLGDAGRRATPARPRPHTAGEPMKNRNNPSPRWLRGASGPRAGWRPARVPVVR